MRTMCRFFAIAAVSGLLLPATAMGQKVAYDYSRTHDFGNIRTFAFKDVPDENAKEERTTTYASPLVKERTRAAIAAELGARGIRENNQHPDAFVTTRTSFRTEQVVYGGGWNGAWGPGYGWGWGWGGWGYGGLGYGGWGYGPSYVEEVTKGSLIIDLVDASTGQLLWRGTKEGTMHPHKDPEERTEKSREVVAKIFKKFPESGAVATSGYDIPRSGEGDAR